MRVRPNCGVPLVALGLSLGAMSCADQRVEPTALRTPSARRDVSGTVVAVTNTDDDGAGSLRDAIRNAPDGAAIEIDASIAGGTITLTGGELSIVKKSLTIEGPVTGGITIDAGGLSRALEVSQSLPDAGVTLRNLTVTGGSGGLGGGIIAVGGVLTLDHVLVTGNEADQGGGIYFSGIQVLVVNSTIAGNRASQGGAMFARGLAALTNATVANNSTGDDVSAAVTGDGVAYTIRNSIIAGNVHTDIGDITNCEVNTGAGDAIVLAGTNLSDTESCGAAGPDMLVTDPALGDLADNGGPTRTLALLRTSPAIDAVSPTDCTVDTDQRYVSRPQGTACDIGAYEFTDFESLTVTIDGSATVNPSTGVATVTGTMSCPEPTTLTLHVVLAQPQKAGRVNTTVSASGDIPLDCGASQAWGLVLTPPTGAFQNGSGTIDVSSSDQPKYFLPISASRSIKLYWAHKP